MIIAQITFAEKLCKGRIVYDNLAKLHNEIITSVDDNVYLNITTEGRFGRTFMFLISCLHSCADQYGKTLIINVTRRIYEGLARPSISDTHQMHDLGVGKEIRIVRLETDENTLNLAKLIVKDIPVDMSQRLNEDMISKIGEMFNNAREHSNALHVFGGRYRKKSGKRYCFACYDSGIGIPERVRRYLSLSLEDQDALRWALKPFHSTAPQSNSPRGQGFKLLQDFTRLNHGVIRICSGRVLYIFDCTREDPGEGKFQELLNSFHGTLFEMDVNTDDRRYQYKGEPYDSN